MEASEHPATLYHDSPTPPSAAEGPLGHPGRVEMNQDEIDAIIRNKRKVRDPKACYACHRRKVKCDRNLPCDSCVKRDHPELCSYERPTKKRRIVLPSTQPGADADHADAKDPHLQSGPNVTVPREQWERLNAEILRLKHSLRRARDAADHDNKDADQFLGMQGTHDDVEADADDEPEEEEEREGIHAQSSQMTTMHLGSRSVLAYMMGLGRSESTQKSAKDLLEDDILPKLGLDNESATYPFVDLWSTSSSMQDVHGLVKAIPEDSLCREFFVCYRDVACTIYPVVPDCAKFGDTLEYMLGKRAQEGPALNPDKPWGVTLPWLALVFAVFASGAQSSDRPAKERELTSQVYICCSYQALRMSNFLTHPCLETIEAALIIGNVLSYNMNPGVSYIFLGMTLRMAFSIGLQINSQHFSDSDLWTRRRIWWALAWQDSHFAISYDRPTSSILCTPDIPYGKFSSPGQRSYAESMYNIIRLTQEIIRNRLLHPRSTMSWAQIQKYKDEVTAIVRDGAEHLREREKCYVMTQHLERLALKLHSSYITSELCRPALKQSSGSTGTDASPNNSGNTKSPTSGGRRSHNSPRSPSSDVYIQATFRRECILSLEGTVEAYVELHSLSKFAARSWIGIQRSISAAFLLGTLSETNQDPKIQRLLRQLEQVILQRTTEDPTFETTGEHGQGSPTERRRSSPNAQPPLAESPHWARTMAKSLNALGKLNAMLTRPQLQSQPQPQPQPQQQACAKGIYSNGIPAPTYGPGQGYTVPTTSGATAGSGRFAPVNIKSEFPKESFDSYESYSPTMTHNNVMAMSQGTGGMLAQMPPLVAPGLLGPGPGGPITPDSTGSSGDWNYTNVHDRAAEFVQAPLWGEGGLGSYAA